jgi:translation initiation factor IF-1
VAPRSDLVEMSGLVKEVMANGHYRVEVKDGHWVIAERVKALRATRILLGDKVTVAVPNYDPTRGLIVQRADSIPDK